MDKLSCHKKHPCPTVIADHHGSAGTSCGSQTHEAFSDQLGPRRNPQRQNRFLRMAPPDLPAALQNVVEYRKSGLSLNHIVGCPLDCGYCVRHLFDNFDMKQPHLVLDDAEAVDALVNDPTFRPHTTPIQLLNRATECQGAST